MVFATERDYEYYVETLSEYRSIYGVRVYAWCLMTNPIHLIVEPPEDVAREGKHGMSIGCKEEEERFGRVGINQAPFKQTNIFWHVVVMLNLIRSVHEWSLNQALTCGQVTMHGDWRGEANA